MDGLLGVEELKAKEENQRVKNTISVNTHPPGLDLLARHSGELGRYLHLALLDVQGAAQALEERQAHGR